MPPSASYQVFLWPGRGLVLSSAIVATPHRHEAVQLTLGLDGPFLFRRHGGPWQSAEAALLAPGVVHELDGQGRTQANLYVEPKSKLGIALAAKWAHPGTSGLLPANAFGTLRRDLRALARRQGSAEEAWALYAEATQRLLGPEGTHAPVDERVVRALQIFDSLEKKRMSARELAHRVFLSESRLSHLFSEQLGLPIKRYLLWLKVVVACGRVRSKDNVTQAARAAGFTDSAHLTHALRRLIGVSPRALFAHRDFVRLVTAPDPRLGCMPPIPTRPGSQAASRAHLGPL